jgi:hypothetical protein
MKAGGLRVVVAFGLLALAGCASNWGSLNLATTKNVGIQPSLVQRNVEGEDCLWMFLFIPIGKLNPNIEEAINDALGKAPEANLLSNVSVSQHFLFTYIVNRSCLRVKGDAVRVAP